MSSLYFDDPVDRILRDCLQTISSQANIIYELTEVQRKLKDALDNAMRRIKELEAKAKDARDASIA